MGDESEGKKFGRSIWKAAESRCRQEVLPISNLSSPYVETNRDAAQPQPRSRPPSRQGMQTRAQWMRPGYVTQPSKNKTWMPNHSVTQISPLWKGAVTPPHSIPNIPWHPEELSSWKWRYRTRGAPDGQGRANRDNRFGLRDNDNDVSPTSNATYLLKNEPNRLRTLQMMPLLWSFTQEATEGICRKGEKEWVTRAGT